MTPTEDSINLEEKTSHFWQNKYFEYQDTQNDCGHTCLSMVTSILGSRIQKNWFRKYHPPSFGGLSILELKKIAKSIGIDSEAFQCDWETLGAISTPAILYFESHFVVLSETKKGKKILANPAIGIMEFEEEKEPDGWSGIGLALRPNENFAQKKDSSELPQLNFIHFLPLIGFPVLLILFSFIPALVYLTEGKLFHKITSELFGNNGLTNNATYLLVAMIILQIAKDFTDLISFKLLLKATERFDLEIGRMFFKRLLKLNFKRFQSLKFGDLDLIFDELTTLRRFMIGSPLKILSSLIMVIILGYFSWSLSPDLLIIPLIGSVVSMVFLLPLRRQILNQSQAEFITREKISTLNKNYFSTIDLVSRFRLKSKVITDIADSFKNNLLANNEIRKNESLIQLISGTITVVSDLAIIILLLKKNEVGEISSPDMILGYWISTGLLGCLTSIITILINYSRLKLTFSRIGIVISPESEEPTQTLERNSNEQIFPIEIENISFSYINGSDLLALNEISISFEKPGIYGIFGKSGSGKSTLGLILSGLYNPSKGLIKLNGKIADKDFRLNQVSYVFQDEAMFNRSIIENITLNETIECNTKFSQSTNVATFDFFTNNGMDVKIDELSEGQKQRIALSRALFRDRKIIILDEGTHSLDVEIEKKFFNNFKTQHPESILIIISHRISTIQSCDKVFVIEDGRITNQGSPFSIKDTPPE